MTKTPPPSPEGNSIISPPTPAPSSSPSSHDYLPTLPPTSVIKEEEEKESSNPPQTTSLATNETATSKTLETIPKAATMLGEIWSSKTASQAYTSQKLRTNVNDVENEKIRVAFRNDTNETLVLCWISVHGKPFHFYELCPSTGDGEALKQKNADDLASISADDDKDKEVEVEEAYKKDETDYDVNEDNIDNSTPGNDDKTLEDHDEKAKKEEREKNCCPILFISKKDHIENSFLGHAFVFARKPPPPPKKDNDPVSIEEKTNLRKPKQKNDEEKSRDEIHGNLRHRHKNESKEEDGNNELKKNDDEISPTTASHNEEKKSTNNEQFQKQKKKERSLNPKDVIGGYRPTSLTLVESSKDVKKKQHLHLVTITKRRKHDNNVENDANMKTNDENGSIQNGKSAIASEKKDKSEKENSDKNDENEYEYILIIKEEYLDTTPIDTTNKFYTREELGGWPVRCEPGWDMCDGVDNTNIRHCDSNGLSLRERLAYDIQTATSFLPPKAREKLRQTTPVWINKSFKYGPKVAPIQGRGMCFHPGKDWLVENGMTSDKCHGIELYNASGYLNAVELWGQGGNMLHEFCHAYHAVCVPHGYDNPDVKKAYMDAMDEKLYDCVKVHGPQGPMCKAYACTDPMEYFAELSTAFLGTEEGETREFNKWFPFNRDQIRDHDPGAYEMLTKTWGLWGDGIQNPSSTSSHMK